MNRRCAVLIIMLCAVCLWGRAFASEEEKAPLGKGIFTKYKCRGCHSVDAAGIKKVRTSTAKHKPPDLSGVGLTRDHEWIEKFLRKEEKIEGRLHPIKFRGTKDELEALAAWLETMKTAKAESGKAGAAAKQAEPPAQTAQPAASESTSMHHGMEVGDTTHAK
jgi:Cytochrome c